MKLWEILTDKLLDSFIFEQAFRRRELETKITDISYPIIEHLIKVLKWHDEVNYDKHCGDIDGWFDRIQSWKMKVNRKPDQLEYHQWIFKDIINDRSDIVNRIKRMKDYHSLPVKMSDDEVFQHISNIMYQISYDLPVNKFESILDYLPRSK
jgi:hypothetical protein